MTNAKTLARGSRRRTSPTPISPSYPAAQDLPKAVGRLRRKASEEIERLLAFLDAIDGDFDFEPAGDEIDASYPEGGEVLLGHPNEDDEDVADHEPSLGFLEAALGPPEMPYSDRPYRSKDLSQTGDCAGLGHDLEMEHDGREPDQDGEASLGWTAGETATGSYVGATSSTADLEEQCEDEGDVSDTGIGDSDGLMEQVAGSARGCRSSGFASHVE